jgi:hypothetical protein
MLVKLKQNSYLKVVPPRVWVIMQQRNERKRFLEIKLVPKSNENPSKNLWEGEWVREFSVRAQHPLPTFIWRQRGECTLEGAGSKYFEGLKNLGAPGRTQGPADLWGRPGPWWACLVCPLASSSSNSCEVWKFCARLKLAPKICSIKFSKGFLKLKKYFWYFHKRKIGARKILACRKIFCA